MNIPIGWLIAFATALGGFYWLGGELHNLWVPEEYLIIFGAALGTLVASNKSELMGVTNWPFAELDVMFVQVLAPRSPPEYPVTSMAETFE